MSARSPYTPPAVADLGSLADGTAWFGTSQRVDVLVSASGQVLHSGPSGSNDACMLDDGSVASPPDSCMP